MESRTDDNLSAFGADDRTGIATLGFWRMVKAVTWLFCRINNRRNKRHPCHRAVVDVAMVGFLVVWRYTSLSKSRCASCAARWILHAHNVHASNLRTGLFQRHSDRSQQQQQHHHVLEGVVVQAFASHSFLCLYRESCIQRCPVRNEPFFGFVFFFGCCRVLSTINCIWICPYHT